MKPTAAQVAQTQAVVEWYRSTYFGTADDLGLASTFCDPKLVGHFAVERSALEAGDDRASFRLLVTVAMFQRLRDAFVMRILQSISAADAQELTDRSQLASLAGASGCPNLRSNATLLAHCDLHKDAEGLGVCHFRPSASCHLKRHTELLKRYGHFGKMPTSAALVVGEHRGSLRQMRDAVWASHQDPTARSAALTAELSRVWRISDKLSAMYLSIMCTPKLGLESPPWIRGVDWTWFVVVDQNVDAFLASLGYGGAGSYSARRAFVQELAAGIDLRVIDDSWPAFHPRLVQQAMYMFMSRANRIRSKLDCRIRDACNSCPETLKMACPVRRE